MSLEHHREAPSAIHTDRGAIFVSLELSRSTWLITSLSPGGGEKLSKHAVRGSDVAGLLERLAQLRAKARARTREVFPLIVIQEAGLDGFWIHRVLQSEGIESTSSIRLRSRHRVGGRRPTGSMAKRWFVRCSRTSEASRGLRDGQGAHTGGGRPPACLPGAQGADRGADPARQPRQGAAVLAKGLPDRSRCAATGGSGWKSSRPAIVARCRII
jgi:hypothetical protein